MTRNDTFRLFVFHFKKHKKAVNSLYIKDSNGKIKSAFSIFHFTPHSYGIIVLAFVGLIVILSKITQPTLDMKNIIVGEVDKGTIETTVNASGRVVPLNEEIIVSPISSRIIEVYKNMGETLNVGEPILKLELASVETNYKQKLDEREMKRGKLTQTRINLDNNISELQMQYKVKEMNLKQMQTEFSNERYLDSIGASTSEKVRQAQLKYEVTKLELEQLSQKVKNEKAKATAEMHVQELDLSMFEKSLGESARLLKDSRITSPQKATLTYINNQIGAQVSAGTQIAIVSDLSHYKIEAEIADLYAEKLSAGTKAIVKIGQQQIGGTVVNITPSVKNGIISFTVMLNDPGFNRLRSGLKTDVYIAYGIYEDVMRIPNSTFYKGKGGYKLWVINENKAETRNVSLGESNFDYIEVISGLQPGEKVILSDMTDYEGKNSIKINFKK